MSEKVYSYLHPSTEQLKLDRKLWFAMRCTWLVGFSMLLTYHLCAG
jgi:hypothetical protein